MIATIRLSGYPEPILVKVGSVDQDYTVLHLLDRIEHIKVHKSRTITVPCMDGYLDTHWRFKPLPSS